MYGAFHLNQSYIKCLQVSYCFLAARLEIEVACVQHPVEQLQGGSVHGAKGVILLNGGEARKAVGNGNLQTNTIIEPKLAVFYNFNILS